MLTVDSDIKTNCPTKLPQTPSYQPDQEGVL